MDFFHDEEQRGEIWRSYLPDPKHKNGLGGWGPLFAVGVCIFVTVYLIYLALWGT